MISDGDESFSACCLAGDLGDAFPSGRAGGENSCPGDEDRDGGEWATGDVRGLPSFGAGGDFWSLEEPSDGDFGDGEELSTVW